jgi:hypothetical protein
VLPADVVSALGQPNSIAKADIAGWLIVQDNKKRGRRPKRSQSEMQSEILALLHEVEKNKKDGLSDTDALTHIKSRPKSKWAGYALKTLKNLLAMARGLQRDSNKPTNTKK